MTSSDDGGSRRCAFAPVRTEADERPVVAVDCNGADLGPAEVAAGAALAAARARGCSCSGPPASWASAAEGVEIVDAPVSIAKSADPVQRGADDPEASIVQAARAVAEGRAQALVCAGGTGAALAAGCSTSSARGASTARRWRSRCPCPRAGDPAGRRRKRRGAARAPRAVRVHGRGAGADGARSGAPARGAAVQRRGGRAREPAGRGGRRRARARARRRHDALEFVGNVEGGDVVERRRGRDRDRRADREHRAEADGGRLPDAARRASGTPRCPRRGRSWEARCCARRCGGFATSSTRRSRAAPTCWGCGASGWCRTGASRGRASRRRSCARSAARSEDIVGRTQRALGAGGRAASGLRPCPRQAASLPGQLALPQASR